MTNPASDIDRANGLALQKAIRSILREAVEVKGIALDALRSLSEPFKDDDQAERARVRAQAITGLSKAYAEAVEIIRIERGKPLPGSLRPTETKSKRKAKAEVSFTPAPVPEPEPDKHA